MKVESAMIGWRMLYPFCIALFYLLSKIPNSGPFLLAYLIYVFLDPSPSTGYSYPKLRDLQIWKLISNYFPMQFIKTHDFEKERNYLFCYTNGSLGFGGFINFCTEANEFKKHFDFNPYLMIPSINFYVPFARDLLLAMGCAALNRNTFENIIAKGKAESIVMSVDVPLNFELGKSNYKQLGFVKFALQHGIPIVPVISIGEDEIWYKYEIKKDTLVYQYIDSILELLSMRLGKSRTVYFLGPLPKRVAIKTIVGKPIEIPLIKRPNLKEILHYYEMYKTSLNQLMIENKI